MMAIKNRELIFADFPEKGMMVEWGSGTNTLWFMDQMNADQRLISIEHKKDWFDSIARQSGKHPKHNQHSFFFYPQEFPLKVNVKDADYSEEMNTFATPYEELTAGLSPYINPHGIVPFEDVDLFLIDGVARGACLSVVYALCKDDAVVYLHDVRDRNWYDWAILLWPNAEYVTANLMRLTK